MIALRECREMGSRKRGYIDEKYNERGLSTALNQTTKVHKKAILETCKKASNLFSPKICSVVWRFGSDHTDQRELQ